MVGEFSESVRSVGRRDPAAVAVHVPQDERLMGEVARPDERVRVAIAKPCLEVGRVATGPDASSRPTSATNSWSSLGFRCRAGAELIEDTMFNQDERRVPSPEDAVGFSRQACVAVFGGLDRLADRAGAETSGTSGRGAGPWITSNASCSRGPRRAVAHGQVERAAAGPQVADRDRRQPVGQRRVDVDPRAAGVRRGVDAGAGSRSAAGPSPRPRPAARSRPRYWTGKLASARWQAGEQLRQAVAATSRSAASKMPFATCAASASKPYRRKPPAIIALSCGQTLPVW